MVWCDAFKWDMSRQLLEDSLTGHFLGEPTSNAIGLPGNLYGEASFLMLHFTDTSGEAKLSRLDLSFDESTMDDERIETLYAKVRNDAVLSYSDPVCFEVPEKSSSRMERFSEKITWMRGAAVMTLSMKRLCDGFKRGQAGVFLFAGDAENDPVARLSTGCIS